MKFKTIKIDKFFLLIVLTLLAFGLISLYSASTVESFKNFGNPSYYIKHQLLYGTFFGLVTLIIFSKIDYHRWKNFLPILLFGTLILLALVEFSPYGFSANGAERWLKIGPVFLQPAELAKIAIIIYLAAWIEKKENHINDFYFSLLPSLLIVAVFSALILMQPDFGTMLVLISVAFFSFFVGGINWRYFFWSAIAGFLVLYALIHFEPYRIKRLSSFINPQTDPQGIGYQINQALIAIGAGGIFGYGYGLSRQKHSYLPEAMGDSIFAIISEELGFIRVLLILILFSFLFFRGFKIAKNAPDTFGKILSAGIVCWFSVQALINIGGILKLIPLTGIPLPFFSYGSTALLVNLASVGILLNISKYSKT